LGSKLARSLDVFSASSDGLMTMQLPMIVSTYCVSTYSVSTYSVSTYSVSTCNVSTYCVSTYSVSASYIQCKYILHWVSKYIPAAIIFIMVDMGI